VATLPGIARWRVAMAVCRLAGVYTTMVGVLLALAIPFTLIAFFFFHDLWMYEGVTVFKRRRVLRSGTAAPARVLSVDVLDKAIGRLGGIASPYSIVYDVLPPGEQPFRAKGIEVMTDAEGDANLGAARGAALDGTDVTVQVKFDPESHLVVLVRVDAKKWKQKHEAARRKAQDALLRGGPRP
jgi:hypothetical protein